MNTNDFIEKYSTATRSLIIPKDFDEMTSYIVNYEKIRRSLLSLEYKEYLRTDYWRIISCFMRSKFHKCKCGRNDNLHVHHNTYKYIGIEHLHANCLEVLCESCHSLIHSCEGAPKSKDKGKGYKSHKDKELLTYEKRVHNKKELDRLKPFNANKLKSMCEKIIKDINSCNLTNLDAIELIEKLK